MIINLQTSTEPTDNSETLNCDLYYDEQNIEHILIVDDEKIVRNFISECLSFRYHCVEASSAEEAFEILKEKRFSLVITDWVMTGKSGTTLLRYIVREIPDTPVIMVTGVNHPERALDAMRIGAFDYLLKPCKPGVLEFTVERALKHRNLEIKARQYKVDLELQNIELIKQKAKLEKLQMRMIHAEKMASLGQLSAGIAHEINNPLGYVGGNLQLLNEELKGIYNLLDFYEKIEVPEKKKLELNKIKEKIEFEELKKHTGQIITDCNDGLQRISELVKNLRLFSKLDQPSFIKTDINRDIDSTVKILNYFMEKENIKLNCNYGKIPLIDAFAGHLNQVWMDILLNAAQSIEDEGGEITITTENLDDFICVKISDTGEGIAPENLDRIFEPFFTTRSIGCGVGLGLSTAHSIVEEHYGFISVESKLHKGTTFSIKLPVIHLSEK